VRRDETTRAIDGEAGIENAHAAGVAVAEIHARRMMKMFNNARSSESLLLTKHHIVWSVVLVMQARLLQLCKTPITLGAWSNRMIIIHRGKGGWSRSMPLFTIEPSGRRNESTSDIRGTFVRNHRILSVSKLRSVPRVRRQVKNPSKKILACVLYSLNRVLLSSNALPLLFILPERSSNLTMSTYSALTTISCRFRCGSSRVSSGAFKHLDMHGPRAPQ